MPASVLVVVELELDREPPAGWVVVGEQARRSFAGLLELMGVLEGAHRTAAHGTFTAE